MRGGDGKRTLVADEGARDVDLLTSHDYHLLPEEQLLREHRGQPPEEVAAAVHQRNLLEDHRRFGGLLALGGLLERERERGHRRR